MPERKITPQQKYDKANTTRYQLKLNNKTDADIIQKLKEVESMQGYIKQCIREELKKEKKLKVIAYPAIFYQEKDSVWAEFPDLEGCQSFADTLEECIVMAQEALESYIESVLERDKKIVPASDIKSIKAKGGGIVVPIYCKLEKSLK